MKPNRFSWIIALILIAALMSSILIAEGKRIKVEKPGIVEYYTPAPYLAANESNGAIIIEVKSAIPYKNIKTYIELPETKKKEILYKITVNGDILVNASYLDTNNDSYYDRLVWYSDTGDKFRIATIDRELLLRRANARVAVKTGFAPLETGFFKNISMKYDKYELESDAVKLHGLEDIDNLTGIFKGRISYPKLNTEIIAVNPINITGAEIALEKYGSVDSILKCGNFDFIQKTCKEWHNTGIPFSDNGTYVFFNVTGFSAYGGFGQGINPAYLVSMMQIGSAGDKGTSSNYNVTISAAQTPVSINGSGASYNVLLGYVYAIQFFNGSYIEITETVSPSPVNLNQSASTYGHVQINNGTNLTNYEIEIHLNGTKLTLDDMTAITGNYSFSTGYHIAIDSISTAGGKGSGGSYTMRISAKPAPVANSTGGSGGNYTMKLGYIEALGRTVNETLTDSLGNYNYTFTSPGYGGNFSVKINATYADLYGYQMQYLSVETTPPTINWVNSTGYPGNFSNTNSITFYVNATDDNPDSCMIYTNASGSWVKNVTVGYTSNVMTAFTTQIFGEGSYNWSVWCNDSVGNLAQHNKNYTLVVDTTAPLVKLLSPLNNSWNSSNSITFRFNVTTEANMGACRLYLNTSSDAMTTNNTIISITVGIQNTTTTTIPDGIYKWNIWCNDSATNTAFNSTNYTMNIDTTIPAIAFRNPTDINNTIIDSKNNRTWTFINVSFAEINNATFIISFNGTNYTDANGGIGFFYKNITIPADGTFTYYAWINDSAGNSNVTEIRTIRFTSINITETLQPSLANVNENVSVFGHINLTNGTNMSNEAIGIYLNGTQLTLDDMTSITGNYSFSTGYHAVITYIGSSGDKATGGGYTARVTANTIVGNATNGSYSALVGYIRTLTRTINETITDSRGNYNYTFTGPGYGGSFPVKINLTYSIFTGSSTATLNVETTPPTINWVNSTGFPTNITTASSIIFYVNATDDNPANCTIYTNASGGWAANATNSYNSNAMSSFAAQAFPANAVYKWSVWCNDTVANLVQHNKNYTLTIDTLNPMWTGVGNNASIVSKNNTMVNWSVSLTDNFGLSTFTFSFNGSGLWQNDSAVTISGSSRFANVTKTINAPAGSYICARFFFNDTAGNSNLTDNSCFSVAARPIACNVTTNCAFTDIFHMAYTNDSHAELNNGTDYTNKVCCANTDGNAMGTGCVGSYVTILHLSDPTNAHAELNNASSYIYNVCINTTSLGCSYRNICYANETCVASVSTDITGNDSNNHVADCITSPYATKICCGMATTETIPPKWNSNQTNATESAPKINDTIQMNVTLTDDTALAYYTFSWNHTGTWQNSSPVSISGTSYTASINRQVNVTGKPQIGWRVFFNDTSGNSNVTDVFTFYMTNTPPGTPALYSPANGNSTTNRTPNFIWNASTDPDGDSITYNISIEKLGGDGSCTVSDNRNQGAISATSHTPANDLQCLWDELYYYNWTVIAYDGTNYSSWSAKRNISISSLVDITILNSTVNFGTLALGATANTTGNNPYPVIFENSGNVFLNISTYATSLWLSILNPTSNYQFLAGNSSETKSFQWNESIIDWTNMPLVSGSLIKDLNYSDLTDSAELELKVTVPAAEPSGNKSSTITLEVTRSR